MKKICKVCEKVGDEDEFMKNRKHCKECFKKVNHEKYLKNQQQKMREAYIPTGRPRGRPKRILEDDNLP